MRHWTCLMLIAVSPSAVARDTPADPRVEPGSGAGGGNRDLVDFEGPVGIWLYEDFLRGSHVFLRLKAPRGSHCGTLAVSEERLGEEVRVTVQGIRIRGGLAGSICMAEAPEPAEEIVDLTNEVGRRELILNRGEQSDAFALDITATEMAIRPIRPQRVSTLEDQGTFTRVPPHSVWLSIVFSEAAGPERFRKETNDLLAALEAVGAHRFEPAHGKYATFYGAWDHAGEAQSPPQVSSPPPVGERDHPVEDHFFHYEGRFNALGKICKRWKKYDQQSIGKHPPPPGGYMSTRIGGWDGGRCSTSP